MATANGEIRANRRLELHIDELDEDVTPVVLPNTPSVLSIGRRVVEKGYDFVWRHGEVPYLLHPDEQRRIDLVVQDFCPFLEIKGGQCPTPPTTRRRSAAKASAAATQTKEDSVLNIHAKEFYPEGHTVTVDANRKRRRGRGARWAASEVPSDKVTSAPATVRDDGDAVG